MRRRAEIKEPRANRANTLCCAKSPGFRVYALPRNAPLRNDAAGIDLVRLLAAIVLGRLHLDLPPALGFF